MGLHFGNLWHICVIISTHITVLNKEAIYRFHEHKNIYKGLCPINLPKYFQDSQKKTQTEFNSFITNKFQASLS